MSDFKELDTKTIYILNCVLAVMRDLQTQFGKLDRKVIRISQLDEKLDSMVTRISNVEKKLQNCVLSKKKRTEVK